MCVTSGGGVKLSAYVGIHIVICGFRAFICAFCSALKFTAFNKFLNFKFFLSAESLPMKFPVFYFRCLRKK